jgi:hypothetical protein
MIKDDPSVIKPTLEALKKTFLEHKTNPLSFRRQQLENLKRGLTEMTNIFYEAFEKDLG